MGINRRMISVVLYQQLTLHTLLIFAAKSLDSSYAEKWHCHSEPVAKRFFVTPHGGTPLNDKGSKPIDGESSRAEGNNNNFCQN